MCIFTLCSHFRLGRSGRNKKVKLPGCRQEDGGKKKETKVSQLDLLVKKQAKTMASRPGKN